MQDTNINTTLQYTRPEEIYEAAKQGDKNSVEHILKTHHIWRCRTDENGHGPLHHAAMNGHVAVVELLLRYNFFVSDADSDGYTPLHHASIHGHTGVIDLLINTTPNIIHQKQEGGTALHFAAANGHRDGLELLLNRGLQSKINDTDDNDRSPLLRAIHIGNLEVVRLLIDRGAYTNNQNHVNNWSPIYTASFYGYNEIVRLLIDRHADVNINTSVYQQSPLHIAADRGNLETVKILINAGADIDIIDEIGYTPIFLACESGHIDIVKELINAGAIIEDFEMIYSQCNDLRNYQRTSKITPIFMAAYTGHIDIVKELITAGANVNDFKLIKEIYIRNNTEMFQLLLDNGLYINEEIYNKLIDSDNNSICKELLVNHIKHLIYNGQDFKEEERTEIREIISIARTLSITTLLQDNHAYFNVDTIYEVVQSLSNNI
jgi:ankyrin repeat protein